MNDFEKHEPAPDWHHVAMGEWKSAEYPDKLETYGLSTCMGIGILNKKGRKGYLGHFRLPHTGFADLLAKALEDAESPHDLEVVLGGHSSLDPRLLGDGATLDVNADRYKEEVVEELRAAGIENVRDETSKRIASNDESHEMIVDIEAGTISVNPDEEPEG